MDTTTVKVPGSCGELAQGMINDRNILISCSIDIYSKVSTKLSKDINKVIIDNSSKKSKKAIEKTLKFYNKEDLGGIFKIESDLLEGKGMGSSTADMVACIAGIMANLNYKIDLQVIKDIILSIEPSDGTFLSGINIFDHKQGEKEIYLGEAPPIDILIFSEPGLVDTVNFNKDKSLDKLKRKKEMNVKKAVNNIKKGIRTGDKKKIGIGATISSFAHQDILYKPHLEEIKSIAGKFEGVLGINIAHSGTLIGILVEQDFVSDDLVENVKGIGNIEYIRRSSLISGGIRIVK